MMKNEKEFLEFITTQENPPSALKETVRKDILLSFRGNSILGKFLFFQSLGALFSMSFCPQFGLGLPEGHGITHAFRMIGDWACASFCASLFLSSGAVMAFIGMKGEELWWVWRRYTFSLVFLPALMWGLLMIGNMTLKLEAETINYHLIWILTAIAVQILLMRVRMKIFTPAQSAQRS